MVCRPTKEQYKKDTLSLLKQLAAESNKTSLSKLQFVQQQVTFLGHVITAENKFLSSKHAEVIENIPKLITKNYVMSFLGMCFNCRSFIPNSLVLEAPLSVTAHGKDPTTHSIVTWTPDADQAFIDLRAALQSF